MTAFDGFLRVYREGRDEDAPDEHEDRRLPAMRAGEAVSIGASRTERRFSLPPFRYTEAGLERALEEHDVDQMGRSGTLARPEGRRQDLLCFPPSRRCAATG